MTGMSDREKAFENKFVHDEEMRFKAIARRNKLFGLWAAGQLGRSDAAAYARDVVAADALKADDSDVIAKVRGDLEAARIKVSEAEIVAKLKSLYAEAQRQLFEE
nr:DUF1476 domain-containing protein [uncultured Gellertiella sp.]